MKTWLRAHWAMLAALACVAVLFGVRSNLSCGPALRSSEGAAIGYTNLDPFEGNEQWTMDLTRDDPQLQELIDLLAGQSYRKHLIQDGTLPGGPDLMIGFYNQNGFTVQFILVRDGGLAIDGTIASPWPWGKNETKLFDAVIEILGK